MIDSDALYKAIGAQVVRMRESQTRKMSQGQLAAILGLQRTSITNIELGKQKLTLDTLYRLCEHFGIELIEVLPSVKQVTHSGGGAVSVGGTTTNVGAKTADVLARVRR